ncbi:MAG: AtpZ/AtpI family protein [Nitrolancea sp.]
MSLSPRGQQDWRAIGAASGLGCSVVASLLLCIGGGILLDRWLGTSPVLTLVGVALGLILSGYLLYQLAVMNLPKKQSVRSQGDESKSQSWDLDE